MADQTALYQWTALVRADGGQLVLGDGVGAVGARGPPTAARVVLRGGRQGGREAGHQAAGGPDDRLLRAPAAVGAVLVGGRPTGAGGGRDHVGRAVRGARGER